MKSVGPDTRVLQYSSLRFQVLNSKLAFDTPVRKTGRAVIFLIGLVPMPPSSACSQSPKGRAFMLGVYSIEGSAVVVGHRLPIPYDSFGSMNTYGSQFTAVCHHEVAICAVVARVHLPQSPCIGCYAVFQHRLWMASAGGRQEAFLSNDGSLELYRFCSEEPLQRQEEYSGSSTRWRTDLAPRLEDRGRRHCSGTVAHRKGEFRSEALKHNVGSI